jgi:hypothetical protein
MTSETGNLVVWTTIMTPKLDRHDDRAGPKVFYKLHREGCYGQEIKVMELLSISKANAEEIVKALREANPGTTFSASWLGPASL